jgi:uncharacterized protein with ATP-grasp and redox domains
MNKKCTKCLINKKFDHFYKHKAYRDGYRSMCIECIRISKQQYYKENIPSYRERTRKNFLKLYHNNINFKLAKNLRNRLNKVLKSKKMYKNNTLKEYLGCSLEELKQHLQLQFQEGMTWLNKGQWHIDHIIPLSSAKTEEELYKLCHYSNLQPLWAEDNLFKSNKRE